jgi:tripartite-type tricarboxylate transporter receptor subunit TctC
MLLSRHTRRREFIAGLGGAAAGLLVASAMSDSARAEDWPSRLVTMVVPYAAGGPVDTVGRIMAAGLSENLHQQVVVENVGGAGGMIGSSRVAKAAPDGYTFLLGGLAVLGQVPNLYKKPLYNPATEFCAGFAFRGFSAHSNYPQGLPSRQL